MSAAGEASTSKVAARVCREGAEAGLAIEEGQADGVPIIDAMDVETIRHV